MYVAVADGLPTMNVMDSTSGSSNNARGHIDPDKVYLSPIDSKLIARKLWPLWEFYCNRAGANAHTYLSWLPLRSHSLNCFMQIFQLKIFPRSP